MEDGYFIAQIVLFEKLTREIGIFFSMKIPFAAAVSECFVLVFGLLEISLRQSFFANCGVHVAGLVRLRLHHVAVRLPAIVKIDPSRGSIPCQGVGKTSWHLRNALRIDIVSDELLVD